MISPRVDEHREAATRAGLAYVTDGLAGITRKRAGKGWVFYAPDGSKIDDTAERKRITSLVIPPAWTDVWICPDPDGHIQATARDARGRKQYRYHPLYRDTRDTSKFRRMLEFSEILPEIRERVERDVRARPHAPPDPRHRGDAARQDADPRGQRRVRARQPLVRPDDTAGAARRDQGREAPLLVSRQERRRARHLDHRPQARAHRAAMSGSAGIRVVQVHRRSGQAPDDLV